MRSIAWNAKVSSRKAGNEISLDATGTDGHPLVVLKCDAPDAETLALRADDMARRITALEDLFTDDEPALLVIMADLDELSKEEIMAMNEMSETVGFPPTSHSCLESTLSSTLMADSRSMSFCLRN